MRKGQALPSEEEGSTVSPSWALEAGKSLGWTRACRPRAGPGPPWLHPRFPPGHTEAHPGSTPQGSPLPTAASCWWRWGEPLALGLGRRAEGQVLGQGPVGVGPYGGPSYQPGWTGWRGGGRGTREGKGEMRGDRRRRRVLGTGLVVFASWRGTRRWKGADMFGEADSFSSSCPSGSEPQGWVCPVRQAALHTQGPGPSFGVSLPLSS